MAPALPSMTLPAIKPQRVARVTPGTTTHLPAALGGQTIVRDARQKLTPEVILPPTVGHALATALDHISSSLRAGFEPAPDLILASIEGLKNLQAQQEAMEQEANDPSGAATQAEVAQGGIGGSPLGLPSYQCTARRILMELFSFFVLVPVALLVLTSALGGVLAVTEDWTWLTGFQFVFSVQCGLANPLGQANNVNPVTDFGRLMTGLVAAYTLTFSGAIASVFEWSHLIDMSMLPFRWLMCQLEKCWSFVRYQKHRPWLFVTREHRPVHALSILVSAFIFAPILLIVPCVLFGLILAVGETRQSPGCAVGSGGSAGRMLLSNASVAAASAAASATCHDEQWPWSAGFFYLLADAAGLPNPLVNESPTGDFGQGWSVYVGLLTFEIGAIAIGYGADVIKLLQALFSGGIRNTAKRVHHRIKERKNTKGVQPAAKSSGVANA